MIRRVRICIWRGGFFGYFHFGFLDLGSCVSVGRFLCAACFVLFSLYRFFVLFSLCLSLLRPIFVPFSSFVFFVSFSFSLFVSSFPEFSPG